MRWLFELKEGLAFAFDAIRAHKLRSGLATLGIVIGIVTVTLMNTAIEGLNRAFLNSVSVLGADVLHVDRRSWFSHSYQDWIKSRNRREITLGQVRAVERQMTTARAVAPLVETRAPIQFGKRRSGRVSVMGTTDQYPHTGGMTVAQGRFFTFEESEGGRPVCVIGSQVASNLFLNEPALGRTVRVGLERFEVVGVLAQQGSFLGEFSLDNQVFIPVRKFISAFWSNPSFLIQVKARDAARLEETKEELRGVLRGIRRVPPGAEDDFAINQQETFIDTFNRVAGRIAVAGLFITGLSLFVGGIGIMNIMFVSVVERTKEIGVRRAVGARRSAILMQFLAEAAGICLLGGGLALALAWPVTLALQRVMPASLSLRTALLALGVSLVTGVVSGFLPAWRAARLDPVEALRNE